MYNSTGDLTTEAIAAAKLVGADRHAEVFERFLQDAMLGDPSMSWEAREQRLESMSDAALERLDEQFFALPSIDTFLQDYVEQHPDEFFRD